jgi:hypothetical protein
MLEATINIVDTVLRQEQGVPPTTRTQILKLLKGNSPPAVYISERQAAQLIGVSVMTVNRWRRTKDDRKGPLPFSYIKTPIGTFRYLKSEVDAYAATLIQKTERQQ